MESEAVEVRRSAWLAERQKGIGASEAAAVLGVSPWCSPLQLWARKRGLAPEQPDNERMKWGRILEPVVAREYAGERGVELEMPEPYTLVWDKERDWRFATPDAYQILPGGKRALVQVKTSGRGWEDGEPPEEHIAQVQHEMAVTGLELVTVACLVQGSRLLWRDVERNDRFIKLMTQAEARFWDMVLSGKEPEPGPNDAETLAAMHPRDSGGIVELPADFATYADQLQQLRAQGKTIDEQIATLNNILRSVIGNNTYGRLPDGSGWKWATVERAGYEVQPSVRRELRRVKRV